MTPLPRARAAGPARARTLGITLAVSAALALAAVTFDRWYVGTVGEEARIRLEARLSGHASALELSLARRAALLDGLTAWMQERTGASSAAFMRVAAALHEVDPGVRALQRVVDGIIVDSYPLEGNEGVIGLDVLRHPDPNVASALARALERGEIAVNGPVQLVQGGVGVILRRTAGAPGDMSAPAGALVVDVATLLTESGIPSLTETIRIAIVAEDGRLVAGAPIPMADDPMLVQISLPEGTWELVAAPVGGWSAVTADTLRSERLALLALFLLGGLLTHSLVGRDTRLGAMVAERTAALGKTAAELREREELLRAALDAGRVSTWSWDVREDRIWRWGSGTSFYHAGVQPPRGSVELIERIHPEDRASAAHAFEEARTTGELACEYRIDPGDGAYAWFRLQGRCSERDEEGPVRIVGAVVDISRLKELEAELVHRGRLELIGQLAGGVVHDLNNALTVVRAELELTLDDPESFPWRKAASEALNATVYGSLLLGQLLTFARKDDVRPVTFDWDGMCRDAASFLSRLMGSGVALEMMLEAEGASVHMDRAQAMQILTNLAVNARDAMDGSGTLTVATRTVPRGLDVVPGAGEGEAVVLEVRDTGTGIPREVQPRIFDAFFTTKAQGRGTGLGLSTTQRIVQESEGAIGFRTSAAGTTFFVVIPTVQGGVLDEPHPAGLR